jgi:hypothetical protein
MFLGTDEVFLGKAAVDHENCCLAFAVSVSVTIRSAR